MSGRGRELLAAGLFLLAAALRADEPGDSVDRLFEPWSHPDSPGGAVGVVRDGQVILQKGYGMADLEHGVANSPRTMFNAGSLAKQFTACAVALLERAGLLNAEDDVRRAIPQLPDYGCRISVRHLIHHTSGLRDYAMLMYLGGKPRDEYHEAQEVIREVLGRQKALNFPPGEKFEYSNSNYLLLGEIVRRVSGHCLREFCAKNLFAPRGMLQAVFNDDAGRIIRDRAVGYLRAESGGFRHYRDNNDLVGDGGLYISIADFCQWEKSMQLPGREGRELAERLLRRGRLNDGNESDYAYGIEHGTFKGLPVIRHSGSYIGFGAMLVRFPLQNLSVVCLSNCDSLDARPMALRVARIFLGNSLQDNKEAYRLASPPDAELDGHCGAYRSPENMDLLVVSRREGRLLCGLNQDAPVAYAPLADGRFKAVEPEMPLFLRFLQPQAGKRGAVQTLNHDQVLNTFAPIELACPSAADLGEFAGEYASEELQARYTVAVEEDRLYVRFQRAPQRSPQAPLRPTIRDEFAAWPLVFRFFRDVSGRIAGFKLAPIGSEHIPFVRLGNSS